MSVAPHSMSRVRARSKWVAPSPSHATATATAVNNGNNGNAMPAPTQAQLQSGQLNSVSNPVHVVMKDSNVRESDVSSTSSTAPRIMSEPAFVDPHDLILDFEAAAAAPKDDEALGASVFSSYSILPSPAVSSVIPLLRPISTAGDLEAMPLSTDIMHSSAPFTAPPHMVHDPFPPLSRSPSQTTTVTALATHAHTTHAHTPSIELSQVVFHAGRNSNLGNSVVNPNPSPLPTREPMTPRSPSSPPSLSPSPLPNPLHANGRVNKALLSAQNAYKAKLAAMAQNGGKSPSGSSTPSVTLVPGINDSPPKRTRTLSSTSETPQHRNETKNSHMIGSPSAKKSTNPNANIDSAPTPKRSASFIELKKPLPLLTGSPSKLNSPVAASAVYASTPASSDPKSPAAGSSHHIRIVPSADEINRDRLGIDMPDEDNTSPEKPTLKPKKTVSAAFEARRAERHRKAEAMARAAINAWSWASIKESLFKSRPMRPVIGGKFALRPTLRFFPRKYDFLAMHAFLQGVPYQCFMLLLLIVSIFATDFTFAFLPASVDAGTSLLLFIILILQSVDLLLNLCLHSNYSWCIYFYFDLIALFSLVVDIECINPQYRMGWDATSRASSLNQGWQMGLADNSYYAWSVNSAVNVSFLSQLSCFLKTLRLLKLCRVVNLLSRKLQKKKYEFMEAQRCLGITHTKPEGEEQEARQLNEWNQSMPQSMGGPSLGSGIQSGSGSFSTTLLTPPPSQLGTIVNDAISIRTIILVVLLGCFIPLLFTNNLSGIVASERTAKVAALNHINAQFVASAQANPADVPTLQPTMGDIPMTNAQYNTMLLLIDSFLASYAGSGSGGAGPNNGRIVFFSAELQNAPASLNNANALSDSVLRSSRVSGAADVAAASAHSRVTIRGWDSTSGSSSATLPPHSLRPGLDFQTVQVSSQPFAWISVDESGTPVSVTSTLILTTCFDSRSSFYVASWLHLLFSLLLILSYLGTTLSLSSGLSDLIIHPFERLVGVVWQLTKSLGIVKESKYRSKNYGSVNGSGSQPHGTNNNSFGFDPNELGGAPVMPLHTRLYRDMKTAILPCKIRAYEIRILDDMISKLCRIFHVAPASRNAVLTWNQQQQQQQQQAGMMQGSGGKVSSDGRWSSHMSKSMRVLTGTRTTEIQTPSTILTVQVNERPLDKELKGVQGILNSKPRVVVHSYEGGEASKRRNSLSSNQVAGSFMDGEHSSVAAMMASDKTAAIKASMNEMSVSHSFASKSGNASAPGVGDRHNSILSQFQSSIIANGAALGLRADAVVGPQSARRSIVQSNKAAMLLGLSGKQRAEFDERDYPELASFDAFLLQPLALTHFRQFLKSKRSLEIFLFYIQVLKFQEEVLSRVSWMYNHFIVVGSKHEINIPAEIRMDILNDLNHPSFGTFDKAQKEVMNLLRGSYQEFMASTALLEYVNAKSKERIVLTPEQLEANGMQQ